MTLTRAAAVTAVAAVGTERDGIQANLLDLDGSLGKRLLAGGSLSGVTMQRWDSAAADLVTLWEIFTAYSAVIDHAAGLRRAGGPEFAALTGLLTGPCVPVTRAPVPLAQLQLTATGRSQLTLTAAVREMTGSFGRITEVVAAAECVWDTVSERLDQIGTVLNPARQRAAGLGDAGLAGDLAAAAAAELLRVRSLLSSDRLSLWRQGRVDTTGLDQLGQQARAAATQVADPVRLRDEADRRIAAAGQAIAVARECEQDARAAFEEAARKIAGELPAVPAGAKDLAERLAQLDAVKTAGRWHRLAAELDVIEREAADAAVRWRTAEHAVRAILGRRGELRGPLDAYRAKAARLGGAENARLAAEYGRAHDLLWSAPCDLAAAANAVHRYQDAVLAL